MGVDKVIKEEVLRLTGEKEVLLATSDEKKVHLNILYLEE